MLFYNKNCNAIVGIDEHLQVRIFNGENTSEFEELYFHENARGDIVSLTNSSGDVALSLEYSSYGIPYVIDDAGELEEFTDFESVVYGFQGRRIDEETSLMYYRNRYYNQQIGCFIQRDKMGYVDGLNLYQAFSMNPYMVTDPYGNWGLGFAGALVGGLIGGVSAALHGGDVQSVVAGIAGGATAGAIIGSGGSVVAGMAAGGAVAGFVNGRSVSGAITGAVVGGAIGAASGAVFSSVSKYVGGGLIGAVLGGEASGLVGGGLSAAFSGSSIVEGMFWGMLEGIAIAPIAGAMHKSLGSNAVRSTLIYESSQKCGCSFFKSNSNAAKSFFSENATANALSSNLGKTITLGEYLPSPARGERGAFTLSEFERGAFGSCVEKAKTLSSMFEKAGLEHSGTHSITNSQGGFQHISRFFKKIGDKYWSMHQVVIRNNKIYDPSAKNPKGLSYNKYAKTNTDGPIKAYVGKLPGE